RPDGSGANPLIALDQRVIFAFVLTLAAGLCTGLGSLLGLVSRRFSPKLLSLSLSFSAGVMIFVSFVEIFPKARQALVLGLGATTGYAVTVLAFFAGMVVIALIDNALPSHDLTLPEANLPRAQSQTLSRTGRGKGAGMI
ncbi:MAG: hypothetical protein NWP84_03405, partial [Cyanobium sp. MAG_04]|nr:hypothetical protein [Cyanobium sp. MAG_04]